MVTSAILILFIIYNINNHMNKDCRLIFDAYTSPGVPTVSTSTATNVPVQQIINKPTGPAATSLKAEEAEKKAKEKTVTLANIDSDRKAIHTAYDIVEAIYRTVDGFERATQVITAIASVHRNERKRQFKNK
jgi:hypothetical protein